MPSFSKANLAQQSKYCKSHQRWVWVLITILVWRHNSIPAKYVAINVWKLLVCGNSPHVQHVRVGPGFFSNSLALPHISKMERQSYYTMESCLHGTAAAMVRRNGPGYSLDRHVTKAGIWFMGQFRVGRDSALIPLPLPQALMGYSKLPYSEHLDGYKKYSVLWEVKKKNFFQHDDRYTVKFRKIWALA